MKRRLISRHILAESRCGQAGQKVGTRAGSVGIYCASEAVADSGLDWENCDKSRVGVFVGVTEHGNVET